MEFNFHFLFQDYIVPATCNEPEFRQMWAVFEWENKVAVNTTLTDLHDYLEHLLKVRILYRQSSFNMFFWVREKPC